MKIEQLETSIEKDAANEYAAYVLQKNTDDLANQKFLTEYVACMAGIDLPVEEETEEVNRVQNFE